MSMQELRRKAQKLRSQERQRASFTVEDVMAAWQYGFTEGQLDPSEWNVAPRHGGGRTRKYETEHEFASALAEAMGSDELRYAAKATKNGIPRVVDIADAMGFESESGFRIALRRHGYTETLRAVLNAKQRRLLDDQAHR